MTQHYQNTAFESGRSNFVDTAKDLLTQATFTAKTVSVTVPNGKVTMVRSKVLLRADSNVSQCDTECVAPLTESVSLEFNIAKGSSNLSALRTELGRLVDKAIADYSLAAGLVPPSGASLDA